MMTVTVRAAAGKSNEAIEVVGSDSDDDEVIVSLAKKSVASSESN